MKLFAIAWKDVRIRMRDGKGLLMLLFMPILLTAVLGAALSGVINGDAQSLPHMTLAVYNGDDGEFGERLAKEVLQSDELKPYVTITGYPSPEAVEQQVADGKADAGVIIGKGFSENIHAGRETLLELVEDPGKPTISQILRSIVTSYTDRVSTVSAVSREVIAEIAKSAPAVSASQEEFRKLAGQASAELAAAAVASKLEVNDQPTGRNAISGQQYYAAAMAAMFLLFNAMVGAKTILNERASKTLSRMFSTPTGKTSILLGKYLGTLLFSIIQFLLFMRGTRLLFGVSWGEAWLQAVVIGIVYAAAVSGLSMTVASVVATEKTVDVIGGIGVQILAVLGGSMIPVSLFPEMLRTIALITPNKWALDSFLNIMSGTTWQSLGMPIFVLTMIGALSLTIGTWRLRAR